MDRNSINIENNVYSLKEYQMPGFRKFIKTYLAPEGPTEWVLLVILIVITAVVAAFLFLAYAMRQQ